MEFFLHNSTRIRIINGALEWQGTPAQFQALEPEYPGLPTGATVRYQTDDLSYYEDADGRHEDTFDALQYCEGTYLTTPAPALTLQGLAERITALEAGGGGGAFVIGMESLWSFASPPAGWLIENGQTVLRSSAYGALLVTAGCPFGTGDGSTTVNIPDRRGAFMMGASATYPLHSTGGAATKTLSVSEIPPHSHVENFASGAGEANGIMYYIGTAYNDGAGSANRTGQTGGGAAFSLLPPYQSTNFIVYVGG